MLPDRTEHVRFENIHFVYPHFVYLGSNTWPEIVNSMLSHVGQRKDRQRPLIKLGRGKAIFRGQGMYHF